MLNINALDKIYKLYGFEVFPLSSDDTRAYSYRQGYFSNVDLVPLSPDTSTAELKKECEDIGYSVSIRNYQSLEDAEESLYNGFFAVPQTLGRIKAEYFRFTKRLSDSLGSKYEYISAPYTTDGLSNQEKNDIVTAITTELNGSGPKLVLLEAAAGYGKTCTAYEVTNRLSQRGDKTLPFLVELSRNRAAKIFKYVLLDEIDRNFPSLNSELVRTEIKRGKIPLVIDGFDELLRGNADGEEVFEDAEPMLQTIGELLTGDAKVILTTRRTAIFAGDDFHGWIEENEDAFKFSRYRIEKPTLADWLGHGRIARLEDSDLRLADFSNPVLLAFLRSLSDESFEEIAQEPSLIVSNYFGRMLEREKERQDLHMSVDEQYEIFIRVAEDMIKEDFTAEDKEYLALRVQENEAKLLAEVRERYTAADRPSTEELAIKLISHALLDRKGDDDQQVGFVNDFVLGTFVGENVEADTSDEWAAGEHFVDYAITAYAPQTKDKKDMLWENLQFELALLDVAAQVKADLALKGYVARRLANETITGLDFELTRALGRDFTVSDCVFADSVFRNVEFDLSGFSNVSFVNCRFYGCSSTGEAQGDIYQLGCDADDYDFLNRLVQERSRTENEQISAETGLERNVLERFWPRGRPNFTRKKRLHTLCKGEAAHYRVETYRVIEDLRKRNILCISGDVAELNLDKVEEVRAILGRSL